MPKQRPFTSPGFGLAPLAVRVFALLLLALTPALAGCALFDSDDDTPSETPAPATGTNLPEPTSTPSTRPSPTPSPVAPTATPTPRNPTQAPDGRTGLTDLDVLIDALLGPTPDEALRFAPASAGPLVLKGFDTEGRNFDLPPEDWSALLGTSERSLFTIVEADPVEFPSRDYNIVLRVREPNMDAETFWNFAVRDGRLVELVRSRDANLRRNTGGEEGGFNGAAGSFQLPSVEQLTWRYLVLPPPEYLPTQPTAHPLSVRTRNPGVDDVLDALASNAPHPNALIGLVDADAINRRCEAAPQALVDAPVDAAFIGRWALDMAGGVVGVHAIVDLPEGYQPAGEHLLIAVVRRGEYWWETAGILEAGGKIVGMISPAWPIEDTSLPLPNGASTTINYRACVPLPPAEYVVSPPDGGLAGLDPARRSGIPLVDALLGAVQAGDAAALDRLIEYTEVPCVLPPNMGQGEIGPACRDGEPEGALVEALPISVCHGSWTRRDDVSDLAVNLGGDGDLALYAMPHASSVVVATADGRGKVWSLGEEGLKGISWECGPSHPDSLIGGDPVFVLPPP